MVLSWNRRPCLAEHLEHAYKAGPARVIAIVEINGVEPEQTAYEISSIKRRFQQSKSRTPLQGSLRTQASKMRPP